MNCPNCQYVLFGLQDPRCPECGREFDVTDFAFRPGSVVFLCPNCRQGYSGNDEHGLPKPRNFQCVRCQRHLAAASMIVQPIRSNASAEELRYGNVWELQEQGRRLHAFWQTVKQLAVRPGEFFRIAYGRDRMGALNFALVCAYLTLAPTVAALIVTGLFAADAISVVFGIALVPIVLALWIYIASFAIQIMLVILRVPDATFDETFQVLAFASVALPVMIVPVVGLPWYVAIIVAGLQNMHRISRGRAITAAVVPLFGLMGILTAALLLA